MKFTRKSLLHDISGMAYVIADIHGEADAHAVHQTFDICEEGNIDRVARMLGLAFSLVHDVLAPLMKERGMLTHCRDFSAVAHDYRIDLRVTDSVFLRLCRTVVHEFVVCHVLADWLSVTMPETAKVWREKATLMLEELRRMVSAREREEKGGNGFTRPLSPGW